MQGSFCVCTQPMGDNVSHWLGAYTKRSLLWLLMPWLLASSGHQHPWYWLQRINGSLSSARRDFSYLCHLNYLEMTENSNILLYSLKSIEPSYDNTCQIWMWYSIDNRMEEIGLVTLTPWCFISDCPKLPQWLDHPVNYHLQMITFNHKIWLSNNWDSGS